MKRKGLNLLWAISAFALGACSSSSNDPALVNPFDTISVSDNSVREKIVVISDLHLGSDLSYSENVRHLKWLEQFLKEVRSSATVKELVIGGDMLDEWYVPTRTNTYGNGTQADFVRKSVAANQAMFDVLNGIIKDKQIKVTYVPGNHDMGFTPENVAIAMPGVNQARDKDEKYGLGTYSPDGYPEIFIEHGHRYDFFCELTPGANESEAPGATLPPGYFFARLAANSFTDPTTKEEATKVPNVVLNDETNAEQKSKHIYYKLWKEVMSNVIYVKDSFTEPIIKTNVGNYTKTYAIEDILPKNDPKDGSIQMKLYNDLFTQKNWEERQTYNGVDRLQNIDEAILGSFYTEFIDNQAKRQYFENPSKTEARIVVFGHTHLPKIESYKNLKGKDCVYVNSGTWEDQKTRDKKAAIDQDNLKMDFVVLTPMKGANRKMQVGLYQYHSGKHCLRGSKEVQL